MEIKHPGSCDSYWQLSTGPHGEPPLSWGALVPCSRSDKERWAERDQEELCHTLMFFSLCDIGVPFTPPPSQQHGEHQKKSAHVTMGCWCRNERQIKVSVSLGFGSIWFQNISPNQCILMGEDLQQPFPPRPLFSAYIHGKSSKSTYVLSQCVTMLVHSSKENIRSWMITAWFDTEKRCNDAWWKHGVRKESMWGKGKYNHTGRSSQILCTRVLR